jgi:hypothetical protein
MVLVCVSVTETSDAEVLVGGPEVTVSDADALVVLDVKGAETVEDGVVGEADEDASVPWIVKVGLMFPESPNRATI